MSAPVADTPTPPRGRALTRVLAATLVAQLAVWGLLIWALYFERIGYWLFDLSDTRLYFKYAEKIASGLRPFLDFHVEYPPLAVPLFRLPGTAHGLAAYQIVFASVMVAAVALSAVATVLADFARHADERRGYRIAIAFALLVLATGGIAVNRYDATVALVFALTLLGISLGWWEVVGVVLGVGFALKITPAFLLPLPLMLAPRRRALGTLAGFGVAAVLPFVPYLLSGRAGLAAVSATFTYHMQRPLEIESLLAIPLWIAHRLAGLPLRVVYSFGSQGIVAPGAKVAAALSTPLVLGTLALLYWALWRRREALRSDGRLVAVAMLAVLLGSMLFSKVLSPQYVVWLLPATALLAADDVGIVVVVGVAMALTQWLFPPAYRSLKEGGALGLAVLLARDGVLVSAFVMSVVALLRGQRTATPPRAPKAPARPAP